MRAGATSGDPVRSSMTTDASRVCSLRKDQRKTRSARSEARTELVLERLRRAFLASFRASFFAFFSWARRARSASRLYRPSVFHERMSSWLAFFLGSCARRNG